MKKYILIASSLLLFSAGSIAEDSGLGLKTAGSAAVGAYAGAVSLTTLGSGADKILFKTKHAFSKYDEQMANKILKDYRLPSSGVVTVEAVNKAGIKTVRSYPYANKKELERIILKDIVWQTPGKGAVSTKVGRNQEIKSNRAQVRAVKGAGVGLAAGVIVAIAIHQLGSSQAGEVKESGNSQIPILADPDEITTTMLISQ